MKPTYTVEFTEEMKGWFAFGVSRYHEGFIRGRGENDLMFHLTIETEDVHRFLSEPDHVASARGWVNAEALGGRLPVEHGVFNLFVDEAPKRKRMLYRLYFTDGVGHPLTLSGYKDVNMGPVEDVWPETSTLYTRILRGHVDESNEESAVVVGAGILHILPLDFARQLTTFRAHGPTLRGRLGALTAFGTFFAGQLWTVFKPSSWRPRRA
jgi:cholesterol oxidase